MSRWRSASHYMLASLSFTAISASPDGTQQYLVYLSRSRSDVFDGLFGGFIRRTIARRLRAEAPQALRNRHESEFPTLADSSLVAGSSW